MRAWLKRLGVGTSFWRQVFTLFSGSFLAQAFAVALTPFIARLYPPTDFGILGVFVALVTVLVVVINGGYEWAIMLPGSSLEAHRLLWLCLWIALGGSALLLAVLVPAGDCLLTLMDSPQLIPWKYVLPLSLLLEGLSQAVRVALNRLQAYRMLSLSKVLRSMSQAILSLGLGLLGFGFEGLLWGFLLGQFLGLLPMGHAYVRGMAQEGLSLLPHKLGEAARTYRDFPRFSVLSTLLHTASRHLPFFLLPVLFSQEVNGLFSQADRILSLPVVLLSMSIGQVYFERASKARLAGAEALAAITRATFYRLALLAVPFWVITLLAGPWLFEVVLGAAWRPAGVYAQWLIPWMALAFITSPLAYLIDIQRKLKVYLWFNLLLFALRLGALWWGGLYASAEMTIALYGGISSLVVGLQLGYLLWLGGVWGLRK